MYLHSLINCRDSKIQLINDWNIGLGERQLLLHVFHRNLVTTVRGIIEPK